MPIFKCQNKDCEKHEDLDYEPIVRFRYDANRGELVSDFNTCPICGKWRETVREKGDIKIPWFKAEGNRNYNNKAVKQYDYDRKAAHATTASISKKKV